MGSHPGAKSGDPPGDTAHCIKTGDPETQPIKMSGTDLVISDEGHVI